jgi:hypothetical protein
VSTRLEEIRDQLAAIAARLEDPGMSDGDAARLATEAAELTAEAASESTAAISRLERES